MDETLERLMQFLTVLQTFNERLTQSQRELERLREVVAPHWQDTARKWHDDLWGPLEETIRHYVNVDGPSYQEFVRMKINTLRGYLDG